MRQRTFVPIGAAVLGMFWGLAAARQGVAAVAVQDPPPQKPAAGPAAAPADAAIQSAVREARAGRVDEALRLIREQAAKHPEWSPPRVILARVLFGIEQAPAARRMLELAAVETPEHPDVYLLLGNVGLADGRLSDARLNFEKAQSLAAAGKWSDPQARGFRREVAAGMASTSEARDDWETARRWLLELLEIEPKNGPARHRLGRALFQLDRSEEAFKVLKQAVEDEPGLEPAAVTMGTMFTQRNDLKKAEEWFDYARKVEPRSARVHRARAKWLLDVGRAADARAAIEDAIKLEPGNTDSERLRAVIAWNLGEPAEAQRILEPLHRDLPADFAIANLLALCLVDQDDDALRTRGLQLAEVDARQAPRSPDAMSTLGWALYRSGKLDRAEQALREAVNGVRTTPDVAYYLARVLVDKGRKDDARKILQLAMKGVGPFAHRKDADALLKTLPQ